MNSVARPSPGSKQDPLAETYPPLTPHEAAIEANRCLYCYDAPCMHACPTHIDIPRFIKKISTGNLTGSARTILEANLLGGTCARVCPVQELCEGACVLGADHKPIAIGRLQRYATDAAGNLSDHFSAGPDTGKRVAVIGAGPAGLSCAGELRKLGHHVTVFDKRSLPGGLSTYGIISLREPTEIAIAEAEMLRDLGVEFSFSQELGENLTIDDLESSFDAIFLSVGLGASPDLGIAGEECIVDGLQFIEQSKMDTAGLYVGANVLVIGAGNTAIDCATIAARLGARTVTMLYRRSEEDMTAYPHEVEFIRLEGVKIEFRVQPVLAKIVEGLIVGLECASVWQGDPDISGRPTPIVIKDDKWTIPCDQVVKAIGQKKPSIANLLALKTRGGFIEVDDGFETSSPGIFAGGDCVRSTGAASTVMAVQDGKLAARAIDRRLGANNG